MEWLKMKKVRENAVLPRRATPGSAGLDLCACIDAPAELPPRGLLTVPTGLALELPDSGCAALVFARSGLGVKHGISLSNGVGVIDSDYRGEIKVGLCNLGSEPYTISPGERIAQLVIVPVLTPEPEEVPELGGSARGEGGFGSTGR